jgi:molybdenum cofactor guanylyltransferase
MLPGLNGLILSGGKSSRMGSDKGTIAYHGKPQREYLFDLLSEICDKVFFSCKTAHNVPSSLNPLQDLFDIESPLNGVLSAFYRHPENAWITVPVDMPLISKEVLSHLIANRGNVYDAVCFRDSEGSNPEPLVCIWEPSCFGRMKKFYEDGHISPRQLLNQLNTRLIDPPHRDFHLNINTPEELYEYLKRK